MSHDMYGCAISFCHEEADGTLWAGHSEYVTQVFFCPKCGYEAKNKDTLDKEADRDWWGKCMMREDDGV